MYVEGEGSCSVAQYSGRYSPVQGAVYGKSCKTFVDQVERPRTDGRYFRPMTLLRMLAQKSSVAQGSQELSGERSDGAPQFLLRSDDVCVDLVGESHRTTPLLPINATGAAEQPRGSVRPVDQFHKVQTRPTENGEDLAQHAELEDELRARREDAEHEEHIEMANKYWSERAKAKDWDCIKADLSVYRYCGKQVTEDPRRSDAYRKKVVDGLGFGEGQLKPGLTETDMAACREVLWRKAAAFWVDEEDSPRTALRYLLHDAIPTGPPCRTPPHRLKGEEADWVDEQLQKEVISGQLVRGNSEWASPPFATKAFAEHRRQRKRRVVVDYRRVNARILRAVYYVRSADGVVQDVAGSMWITLVDACKGFNQVANTRRAREVLAILARSGQYLPVCLTFGPTNGPEDFAFATDRELHRVAEDA